MNSVRRDHINSLADKVRRVCKLNPPVNVREAVSLLGGRLQQSSSLEFEAQIEKNDDNFIITLNQHSSNEKRSRFSIAHELGHLFLHMGYIIDEEKWEKTESYTDSVYHRYGHTIEEYEANEFAAAFLMPKNHFIDVIKDNYNEDHYRINEIANHFDVSTDAAINRGRWLGLFSWE